MRAVIQRVSRAKVTVEGSVIGKIERGFLVLLGIQSSDDEKVIEYMLDKMVNLRVFEDQDGKMNLSLGDVKGDLLIVPNFTLYGDIRRGRRPSFSAAAPPTEAEMIYNRFIEMAKMTNLKIETGQFQADMKVDIVNDGPVTLLLDSDKNF
jgi:D-tyrosyl-tRNA(Tyr) deacylase